MVNFLWFVVPARIVRENQEIDLSAVETRSPSYPAQLKVYLTPASSGSKVINIVNHLYVTNNRRQKTQLCIYHTV